MVFKRQRLRAASPLADGQHGDDELLVRTARGDETAFETLYERLSPNVYGLVRKVVCDPAQSEEVMQEVMTEVWRTAARFDPDKGSARSWMLMMAHRRAVDRVRSEQAHRNRTERIGHRDRDRDFDSVAEAVEMNFEGQQVRKALDRLTDLQRESIELAYFRGLTYREVAAFLGISLGTIKTRIRDGLTRLRGAMAMVA